MKGRKPDLRLVEGLHDIESSSVIETSVSDIVPSHIPEQMHDDWHKVVSDLTERKLLVPAMMGSIDAYVMALWNTRQAQEQITKHGPLIDAGKGIMKQNPAVSLLGKSQQVVMRLAVELGLTPTSRARKGQKPGKEKEDDLFSLMDF